MESRLIAILTTEVTGVGGLVLRSCILIERVLSLILSQICVQVSVHTD